MGSLSIWHWLIVLIVVLLLFGGKKVSTLMGDFAKGIKDFKKNIAEEETSSKGSDTQPTKTLSASDHKDESVSFNEKETTTVSSDSDKK
ncbi:Twin-arginine protein secretion pathway components TatA and TatB (TatA) (PDB:2L16) [Commensalibacter papalotli (ex Botero et al. 2024)]|uniref:Sec-independent protein translocase protein TatA n=2 Tax=Commensalibacter TaxID=1079922 RepID=W7DLZ0_9PROT|nr:MULTISPECIES: twin-arginine translocase TatA/TatE family subunit [Commensalibacter]EUK18327.1 twin arginine translocase protein A [Commensalibacter papalotli (ex Servin-Garciduenas et al. 2014)]CAI3935612.1 Twin-arginine protein secretion pathway components TatA and TatB (TatA) (PDB:2L16) [Commensalibacter papalotli (ex Botero et al. 2024)]CAI3940084.1 Twin-arginine protein secretion pathway components TatA and TatB (TatA) (PDB:2L16) [Commensalibacter papalotli (ex Botero et al. 2024)]